LFEVAEQGYRGSAAATKAELKQLEADLQRADATGDRRQALNILSRMLELQRSFMNRWGQGGRPSTPTPVTGTQASAAISEDDESLAVRSPGRSGSNPDSV
jgi:hypothetical protein